MSRRYWKLLTGVIFCPMLQQASVFTNHKPGFLCISFSPHSTPAAALKTKLPIPREMYDFLDLELSISQ